MKKILTFYALFILSSLSLLGQINLEIDTSIVFNQKDSELLYNGVQFFESKFYYNPLINKEERHVFYSSCQNKKISASDTTGGSRLTDSAATSLQLFIDTTDFCLRQLVEYVHGVQNGIIQYYNSENYMIMSGIMFENKANGVFRIYCEKFPYCSTKDIQSKPIRELVYRKGRLISDSEYDQNTGKIKTLKLKRLLFKKRYIWE
jgi:hypothetical protein